MCERIFEFNISEGLLYLLLFVDLDLGVEIFYKKRGGNKKGGIDFE